jgi:hypothetical protein
VALFSIIKWPYFRLTKLPGIVAFPAVRNMADIRHSEVNSCFA